MLDDPHAGFSGRSLLGPPRPTRTVLSEYHDGGASVGITMVRWKDDEADWKYVHYAEGNPPQLFNLTRDPDETRDLSATSLKALDEGRRRMLALFDPEEANTRAHADQARLIEKLGGREKILAVPQWNFTPADSRGDALA
jgi:choline-sulfatase